MNRKAQQDGLPVADHVYAALREGILDGAYESGVRLGEASLAAALGVSRTPVREALRRLGSEGLVELLPHRGARVARWTERDLGEIYALRALLEGHAAGLAAGHVSDADLARMEDLCLAMERVGERGPQQDFERLVGLNQEFHSLILRGADNERLATLLRTLVQVPLVLRTYHRYSDAALRRSHGHHRELVTALRSSNPAWAESVMRSHVLAAQTALTASGLGSALLRPTLYR